MSGRAFDPSAISIESAIAAKGSQTVSVCIPCRNEAANIGPLVELIRTELVERNPLVDQLLVIDDRSSDDSYDIATNAGAEVVPIEKIHAEYGDGRGKGNVLWASLVASHGDFVVWIDGDITSFEPLWIARLITPLLEDPAVALVKASAQRSDQNGGGGRTTELVARPLMSMYFPELAWLEQPLAGEYAGRRSVLETLPFVEGWGVEIGLLIDLCKLHGPSSITQIDVGVRDHRHHPLASLGVQAAEVMSTILGRVPGGDLLAKSSPELLRPDGSTVKLNLSERPPVQSVRVN